MPVWTAIPKYSGSVSNEQGSPMGLLLLLTYSSTAFSVTNIWDETSKPSTTYGSTTKPATVYDSIANVAQNFLLINSVDFLLINASSEKLLIDNTRDSNYTKNVQPSTPTYTAITKPA